MMRGKRKSAKGSAPKTTKPDRRWTLLLIDSEGKTHTFYRLREAMFIGIAGGVIAAALLGLLVYANLRAATRNDDLQVQIDNLQEAVDKLRSEKEILMARLVVAESRVEENLSQTTRRPAASKTQARPAEKKPPEKTERQNPAVGTEKVGTDDVEIIHDPNAASLRVNYKVLNQGPDGLRVSGRSVVILKPDSGQQKNWLVMPPVPLLNGRPTGEYGKAFSIFNWRTMRFQAKYAKDPYLFKTVTIYVYSMAGELMLEKRIPVGPEAKIVQLARKPPPAEKPAPPEAEKQQAEPEIDKAAEDKPPPQESAAPSKATPLGPDDAPAASEGPPARSPRPDDDGSRRRQPDSGQPVPGIDY